MGSLVGAARAGMLREVRISTSVVSSVCAPVVARRVGANLELEVCVTVTQDWPQELDNSHRADVLRHQPVDPASLKRALGAKVYS